MNDYFTYSGIGKTATQIKPLSYSKKEGLIALLFLPPFSLLLNYVMFGLNYFAGIKNFLLATHLTLCILLLTYISCGMVATVLAHRYSRYSQTFKRIAVGLLLYVTIMVAALSEEFAAYSPPWLCEKYINQVLHSRERSTRATFVRMVKKNAEEKVY